MQEPGERASTIDPTSAQAAKTLLRRTRQSLAVIAPQAGFGDQSHLTTIFHRETGVTPGRFRAELA